MRVIHALWLRQIKRYLRSRSRMIGSMGQPLLYLLAFGYGFGPIYRRAGEGDLIQFIAPGIVAMSVIFIGTFMGIELIWDRQFGFLKETLAAPVSRFKIMLGRTLGGATVATIQGVLVLALTFVFGFRPESFLTIPAALAVIFLIALLFTSLGTAIASTLEDLHGFQVIMNFVIMPVFFLSGALFPLEGLPKAIDVVTKINPLSYGVDALRNILISAPSKFGIFFDLAVISTVSLIILAVGSYLFSKIEV